MMRSKRFLLAVAALAAATWASDSRAQTIAYRNLLQFDLQSYRSQATGGIFTDDVDLLSDAARLLEIDGTRIYTNFSNLSDPATLGDNLIRYSIDQRGDFLSNSPRPGVPNSPGAGPDTFDSGSYLGGWVGKYDQESDYTFSVIYQRSGDKAMFEDLEDFNFGSGSTATGNDAEYTGDILQAFDDGTNDGVGGAGDGDVDREVLTSSSLMRYDDRSASRFDLGAARELQGTDWSLGGRLFWRSDHIERVAEGTTRTTFRQKVATDSTTLVETGSNVTTYAGSMEDAFRWRETGVSLDADWHPGDWSLNSRVDVFGINVTNPASNRAFMPVPRPGNELPALRETRLNTIVTTDAGFNPNGTLGSLDADHTNTSWTTGDFDVGGNGPAVSSIDDERTGIGVAAKLEMDREAWGGNTRTWAGLNRRPMDIDATILTVQRQGTSFWWNDTTSGTGDQMATATQLDDTQTLRWEGDASNTVLEAGSKWWRELSNRVEMGLGVVLTRSTLNQDFRQTASRRTITNAFDDGFGTLGGNELDGFQGGGYNEEQTLVTSTTVTDINDETKTTDIRLPVGAQFNITKKIKWLMGVQHQIRYETRETTSTTPEGTDGQVVTEFTDYANPANDTTTYSTGTQTSGSATVTTKDEFNQTTYWYGLEWLVGDVAQFNINGFFDTSNTGNSATSTGGSNLFDVDFFRNLAVSLTFMFD